MGYVAGYPQQPILLTIDGNEFLVIRHKYLMDEGKPSIEIKLSPFDWVLNRLGWTEDMLDKTEDMYGTVTRTFPLSSRVVLSDNPEKPIWLLLTTIDGENINWDSPALTPIIEMKEKIDSKDKMIERLNTEIERLREENRRLVKLAKELKGKMKDVFGEDRPQLIPEDYLGTKIDKRGVSRVG